MADIKTRTDRGVREYITFRVGTQYFCVDIMSVREIRGWTPATTLPHAPGFVRGVINLRGIVLPIVDLAERLGLIPAVPTARHVIIVAQTARQIIGLLVDAVSDIIAQPAESVQATPEIGSAAVQILRSGRDGDGGSHGQPHRTGQPDAEPGRRRRVTAIAPRQSPRSDLSQIVPGEFMMRVDDFRRIADMIYSDAGIYLHEAKATLVYARLAKRLRVLGLTNFGDYCEMVAGPQGQNERQEMLAALTTNVTRFFREAHHFEHLKSQVLPPLLRQARRGGRVRIWSAACSSGQEPYSIALTILSVMPDAAAHDVKVLATDIDPHILDAGRNGVYPETQLADVPGDQRKRFFEAAARRRAAAMAGRRGAAQSGRLPAAQSDRELADAGSLSCDFLPKRRDLFRRGHATAALEQVRTQAGARGVALYRSFRTCHRPRRLAAQQRGNLHLSAQGELPANEADSRSRRR